MALEELLETVDPEDCEHNDQQYMEVFSVPGGVYMCKDCTAVRGAYTEKWYYWKEDME